MPNEKRKISSKDNPKEKRTRTSLTGAQKQEVCLKKLQKPTPKNKELAIEFSVSEEMIYDILREKEKWLTIKLES